MEIHVIMVNMQGGVQHNVAWSQESTRGAFTRLVQKVRKRHHCLSRDPSLQHGGLKMDSEIHLRAHRAMLPPLVRTLRVPATTTTVMTTVTATTALGT